MSIFTLMLDSSAHLECDREFVSFDTSSDQVVISSHYQQGYEDAMNSCSSAPEYIKEVVRDIDHARGLYAHLLNKGFVPCDISNYTY